MLLSISVILPVNNAQVFRKDVSKFPPFKNKPIFRRLRLEWAEEGNPQSLVQKVVLKGSMNSRVLTIHQPPTPTGMSGMIRSGVW